MKKAAILAMLIILLCAACSAPGNTPIPTDGPPTAEPMPESAALSSSVVDRSEDGRIILTIGAFQTGNGGEHELLSYTLLTKAVQHFNAKNKDYVVEIRNYQVTLVPNYLVSDWLGILKTRWAVWLPAIVSPFSVFLLTKHMRRIPASYTEAAQLDGAGRWQVFRYIYLPLCRGILCSVGILLFIDYWNMVEQPLILLKDARKFPLSVYLASINSQELGIAFAAATIYMIPPGLMFLYGKEYLVQGITYSGGIKA